MTNGEITTLTDTLKILPAIFQISPAHAASAAIFTLLAQVETFKIRTTQLFEKRR
jgi:hypothetical protein